MTTRPFSGSDKVVPDQVTLEQNRRVRYLMTFWQHHEIDICRLANHLLKNCPSKIRDISFMEKSQQRAIVLYFPLNGWGLRKI
jgi:hypothetical protein